MSEIQSSSLPSANDVPSFESIPVATASSSTSASPTVAAAATTASSGGGKNDDDDDATGVGSFSLSVLHVREARERMRRAEDDRRNSRLPRGAIPMVEMMLPRNKSLGEFESDLDRTVVGPVGRLWDLAVGQCCAAQVVVPTTATSTSAGFAAEDLDVVRNSAQDRGGNTGQPTRARRK